MSPRGPLPTERSVEERLAAIEEKLDIVLDEMVPKRRYLCDKSSHWHAVRGPVTLAEVACACVPETIDE